MIWLQVGKLLVTVFERVNSMLEAEKTIDSSLSGTTAVVG